jgi:hypothetical protein
MSDSPELPGRARAWVEGHAPSAVVEATAVGGGMTGTKWVLRLAEGEPLVVRWSDPRVWGATGREHVRREAAALRLLTESPLPVARLIATDPDGDQAGGPANVMTWLPGRVRLDRLSPAAITAWAASAVSVHQRSVPVQQRPPAFSFRGSAEPEVPGWTRRPRRGPRVLGLRDAAFGRGRRGLPRGLSRAGRPARSRSGGGALLDRQRHPRLLPDPAHILVAVAKGRPDLSADDVRRGLEELLALALRAN